MKYNLLLACLMFSSVSFAGNGSGWGGAPALTDQEMQAMSAPIEALGITDTNEVLLRSATVQELVVKTKKGIPVALAISPEDTTLVRPLTVGVGKLELETPDGDLVIVREID